MLRTFVPTLIDQELAALVDALAGASGAHEWGVRHAQTLGGATYGMTAKAALTAAPVVAPAVGVTTSR